MSIKLKKGDVTIAEVLALSRAVYKNGEIDNKMMREKKDVTSGKLTARRGLIYDRQSKEWKQESREIRFDFIVSSKPISYVKTDNVAVHRYPVTFLLKDYEKGLNSSFRWRTGGLKKWKNAEKYKGRLLSEAKTPKDREDILREKAKHKAENQKITDKNIRNGLQGNFIFHLMWVLKQYGLLFGPLTCLNKKPEITNKKLTPFFDKTALYIVLRILPKLLQNPKLNQVFKK